MLIPLMSGSAISAVFTFDVIAVSSIFLPKVVSEEVLSLEADEESDAPGLPAAPLEVVSGLGLLDGSLEGLALLEGLVDGLVDELAVLDGLVGEAGLPGFVESAVVAGLFGSLRVVVWSRPASHALSAKAIAEAITALVKMFMIVSFLKRIPARASALRKRPANTMPML